MTLRELLKDLQDLAEKMPYALEREVWVSGSTSPVKAVTYQLNGGPTAIVGTEK